MHPGVGGASGFIQQAVRQLELLKRLLYSPLLIAGVAIASRLCAIYAHPTYLHRISEMARIAGSLATGHGFSSPFIEPTGPSAYVPPVYPLLLAGIFKLFGVYTAQSAFVSMAVNVLFSALTCLTLFYLGARMFGAGVGALTAWGWALNLYSIFFAEIHWETCLSALLLSLLLLLALRLVHSSSARTWAGFGLLWGFAALTNTALVSFMPFLPGMDLAPAKSARQGLLPASGPGGFGLYTFDNAVAGSRLCHFWAFHPHPGQLRHQSLLRHRGRLTSAKWRLGRLAPVQPKR